MTSVLGSIRLLNRLLQSMERQALAAYLEAVNSTRAANTWTAISSDLESGNVEGVAQSLLTKSVLTGVLQQFRATYIEGGTSIQDAIPKYVKSPRGGKLLFRFDVSTNDAERWLARQSSDFITRIDREQRAAIRIMLRRGMEVGQNPRATALDIIGRINKRTGRRQGGIIGLSERQTDALARARNELTSGDPSTMRKYLRRKRRDRNLDGMVKRAIKAKRPLTAAQVDRVAGRYSDRLLQLRGETIARTESLQAFHAGRREARRQLKIEAGLEDDELVRRWDATMDQATRPDHRYMNGQRREGEEPFEAPDGSLLMHPGDTSLNAEVEQIVNCRCMEVIEADFIKAEARRNQ